jgi:hypothetical protein
VQKVALEIKRLLEEKILKAPIVKHEDGTEVPQVTHRNQLVKMRKKREEYASLFRAPRPVGEPINISLNLFPIDDSIPGEQEIIDAVKKMRRGKTPGGSGIKVENVQEWMIEAKEIEDPEIYGEELNLCKWHLLTNHYPDHLELGYLY